MIEIEKVEVFGFEAAIRGMRNPLNSWDKSDTEYRYECDNCFATECTRFRPLDGCCVSVGENDHDLMMRLVKGGSTHAKFRRMMMVSMDITAPLYWWKEFDTYKVGTVANSCSTMHTIHKRDLTMEDFSCEHLMYESRLIMEEYVLPTINAYRAEYVFTGEKVYWHQIIQLLPSSFNQTRTIMLNYEVLAGMYRDRRNHKLDEWVDFCKWIEGLPYSELITGVENDEQIH